MYIKYFEWLLNFNQILWWDVGYLHHAISVLQSLVIV